MNWKSVTTAAASIPYLSKQPSLRGTASVGLFLKIAQYTWKGFLLQLLHHLSLQTAENISYLRVATLYIYIPSWLHPFQTRACTLSQACHLFHLRIPISVHSRCHWNQPALCACVDRYVWACAWVHVCNCTCAWMVHLCMCICLGMY